MMTRIGSSMRTMVMRAALVAPLLLAQARATQAADIATYRIGPYDVLDISVWNNVELSRTVPVRPDGRISLPLLMDVQAGGLTPMELRDTISKKLTGYVDTPEVAVIVREVNSVTYSVMGNVREPGRFPLRGPLTVVEALAQAGGFTDFAAPRKIFLLRSIDAGRRVSRIPYNYNTQVLARRDRPPLYLQPGDVVVVP